MDWSLSFRLRAGQHLRCLAKRFLNMVCDGSRGQGIRSFAPDGLDPDLPTYKCAWFPQYIGLLPSPAGERDCALQNLPFPGRNAWQRSQSGGGEGYSSSGNPFFLVLKPLVGYFILSLSMPGQNDDVMQCRGCVDA